MESEFPKFVEVDGELFEFRDSYMERSVAEDDATSLYKRSRIDGFVIRERDVDAQFGPVKVYGLYVK